MLEGCKVVDRGFERDQPFAMRLDYVRELAGSVRVGALGRAIGNRKRNREAAAARKDVLDEARVRPRVRNRRRVGRVHRPGCLFLSGPWRGYAAVHSSSSDSRHKQKTMLVG